MCGIAGFVNLSGRVAPDDMAARVEAMANTMRHRGPDDAGVWVDPSGTCALAHRRLSIIDLSPQGHQPMVHAESGGAITFNGEIYNYQNLKKGMEAEGVRFRTASDTEVLLRGLVDEGAAFVRRLDAMFAFGFFDPRTRALTLARDLFGEKPLYYAHTRDGFAFASELHALTALPDFEPVIDRHRIATYLALGYVPAPLSIYTTAHKLPPAHTLTLWPDGQVDMERYDRFEASDAQRSGRSMDDLADELDAILSETVRSRLLTADVPVGAFLSSGVDSSLVVALAMKQVQQPIKTFSIGFHEGRESEHKDSEAMAHHLGTEHHVEILPRSFFEARAAFAQMMDEPNGDSSCLPTWAVSRTARRQATVALSGDGGDELFGGYNRYQTLLRLEAEKGRAPSWMAGAAYYHHPIMIFVDETLEKFIGPMPEETRGFLAALRAPLNERGKPLLHLMRETDIETYMPGDVLAKVDRMSMQHGLEVRAPFLGREVAAFAARMASDDLAVVGEGKRVLKHLAARYIPRAWLDRPKKGFAIPETNEWGGPILAKDVKELLLAPDCRLARWIEPERLRRFVAFHEASPRTYHLWSVFILEQWLRHHPCEAEG